MKGRRELLVAGLVIAAFTAALAWLQHSLLKQSQPPKPPYSTFSAASDGCLALYLLLEESGAEVRRYTGSQYDYPAQGCVAVLGGNELGALFGGALNPKRARLWMEDGGCLILGCDSFMGYTLETLLAELEPDADEVPAPGLQAAPAASLASHLSSGRQGEPSAMLRPYLPGEVYKLAAGSRLWAGAESIEAAAAGYVAPLPSGASAIETLLATYDPQLSSPQAEPVVRYKAVGQGSLIIIDRPEFLTNAWIGRADNHRAALALISLASQGRPLCFDEGALGFGSRDYNGITLITRTLGGRLLIALTAVLALFWLGQAIRPARSLPPPIQPRRQGVEQVYAQASLLLRAGARHSVAEALASGLRRSCVEAGRPHAPSDIELAAWAERTAQTARGTRADLQALAAYLRERFLPRSGGEIAALARACDALREHLRRGERPSGG